MPPSAGSVVGSCGLTPARPATAVLREFGSMPGVQRGLCQRVGDDRPGEEEQDQNEEELER